MAPPDASAARIRAPQGGWASQRDGPAAVPLAAPAGQTPAAGPEVPAHCQLFLAFDFGTRRSGVASGNRLTRSATPQASIAAEGAARWPPIAACIQSWQPDALVVGVPYHPDGSAHENTALALKFARQLRGRFGLPVFEVDERYSSTEAHALGARDVDAAAACIILEQFLRSLP
ncbi:Holliday junction resolvase RuvX [Hydrogenophaga sp.]|uniref:Holliday junction resolvase RuvX n=1 Tax=Hydrogenophaga sp. TaxID=1904254 RepID=UPI0019CDED3F|nr:Holliday junction resolvase RuvX [Hydrogenophaga sp.]MBD3893491.1 Holliday junction resolvase RuvX [Hydrogenophaga sp.]